MLLEIEEIQRRLNEQFLPLEPMLTGFRLVGAVNGEAVVEQIQHCLRITLDGAFAGLIRSYNFGSLTVGPITFCNTGDFAAWFVDRNIDDESQEYPWWGDGHRPDTLLLVAGSDLYAIVLDNCSGRVLAFQNGQPWKNALVISLGFREFLQGIGTVFLDRDPEGDNQKISTDVATYAGGMDGAAFWDWLAK